MKDSEGKVFFKLCDVQKRPTHQEERHEKNNREARSIKEE